MSSFLPIAIKQDQQAGGFIIKSICFYSILIVTKFEFGLFCRSLFFWGGFCRGEVSCICGSRANISDSGVLPPHHHHLSFCSRLALMPLWLCDWELSITCWWTGSVLKKVHTGQKEMAGVWQAASMEGGKAISHRLVGPLLLVKPEPPCYCPGCVRDIPRALFWL